MGTKDIVVVKSTYQPNFGQDVLRAVQDLESMGWTVDIKYAVGEGKYDEIIYTALLHAYEEGGQ